MDIMGNRGRTFTCQFKVSLCIEEPHVNSRSGGGSVIR